jgi:hypothetical protein
MSIQFSEKTGALFPAMFALQQDCGIIGKDAENPHFKSEYVSLEKLWATVKPLLKKHGLMVIQTPSEVKDGKMGMETAVIHVESGEFCISLGQMPIGKEGPQALGSAVTYARRYFLACCLSVVAGDEDDDGEAAEGRKAAPIPKAQLSGLKERKAALIKKYEALEMELPMWQFAALTLKRTMDESMTLKNEEEVKKMEDAVNDVSR